MKNKEEIEQLAKLKYSYEYDIESNRPRRADFITDDLRRCFIETYIQCQEDNKPFFTEDTWNTMCSRIAELQAELNKKYTLDDMKKACACGIDIACKDGENDFQPFEDLINSLNKQD